MQEGQQSLSPRVLDDRLASTVPNLRTLDLTTCKEADAARLMSLRPLRGLRHLALRLPERGLQPLAMEIGALMQLTSLDLSGYGHGAVVSEPGMGVDFAGAMTVRCLDGRRTELRWWALTGVV